MSVEATQATHVPAAVTDGEYVTRSSCGVACARVSAHEDLRRGRALP